MICDQSKTIYAKTVKRQRMGVSIGKQSLNYLNEQSPMKRTVIEDFHFAWQYFNHIIIVFFQLVGKKIQSFNDYYSNRCQLFVDKQE